MKNLEDPVNSGITPTARKWKKNQDQVIFEDLR